jgi:predicted PolB exonuclease-like 3'-5' exonuclease
MSIFAFDIETIPNTAMLDKLPAPEVKYGNAKKPELRAEIEAEAKQKQIDGMALSPFTGIICAYSMYGEDTQEVGWIKEDSDEKAILPIIFNHLRRTENNIPRLITWNGNGFDLPFIYKRAMMLGLDMGSVAPLSYWTKRYETASHCDMMQIFAGWSSGNYDKLADAAWFVLGEKKIDLDYKTFPDRIKHGQGKEIGDYCLQDSKLTYKLWEKTQGYLI